MFAYAYPHRHFHAVQTICTTPKTATKTAKIRQKSAMASRGRDEPIRPAMEFSTSFLQSELAIIQAPLPRPDSHRTDIVIHLAGVIASVLQVLLDATRGGPSGDTIRFASDPTLQCFHRPAVPGPAIELETIDRGEVPFVRVVLAADDSIPEMVGAAEGAHQLQA